MRLPLEPLQSIPHSRRRNREAFATPRESRHSPKRNSPNSVTHHARHGPARRIRAWGYGSVYCERSMYAKRLVLACAGPASSSDCWRLQQASVHEPRAIASKFNLSWTGSLQRRRVAAFLQAIRLARASHLSKPMCARESFFAADSTSSAAMRRALSAPFFPARKKSLSRRLRWTASYA